MQYSEYVCFMQSESRMLHSYTGLDTPSIGRTSKVISIIHILTQVLWKTS